MTVGRERDYARFTVNYNYSIIMLINVHILFTRNVSKSFSPGTVFIISSCEGDGTVPAAVRDLVGRGHEVTVLSPSSVDFERLVSRIPRMSYEVLKLERQNRLTTLAGSGAQVIDWMPDMDLSQALMQVRGY